MLNKQVAEAEDKANQIIEGSPDNKFATTELVYFGLAKMSGKKELCVERMTKEALEKLLAAKNNEWKCMARKAVRVLSDQEMHERLADPEKAKRIMGSRWNHHRKDDENPPDGKKMKRRWIVNGVHRSRLAFAADILTCFES